jgi:hypothetical protein
VFDVLEARKKANQNSINAGKSTCSAAVVVCSAAGLLLLLLLLLLLCCSSGNTLLSISLFTTFQAASLRSATPHFLKNAQHLLKENRKQNR